MTENPIELLQLSEQGSIGVLAAKDRRVAAPSRGQAPRRARRGWIPSRLYILLMFSGATSFPSACTADQPFTETGGFVDSQLEGDEDVEPLHRDPLTWDSFGHSLECLGDVNGDGVDDLAVGDPDRFDGSEPSSGVFVFSGKTGELLFEVSAYSGAIGFGVDVARLSDVDDDGVGEFAICAEQDKADGIAFGVGIYSGATGECLGTWKRPGEARKLYPTIHALSDIDEDGVADLLVAAPGTERDGARCGALYFLSVGRRQVLARSYGEEPISSLGHTVSVVEDLDGDGVIDIAVHARERLARSVQSHSEGKGHVSSSRGVLLYYSGISGRLLRRGSEAVHPSGWGYSMDQLGDWDGDGCSELLLRCSPMGVMGVTGYVVQVLSTATDTVIISINEPEGLEFGAAVAGIGDLDGDGKSELCIGAPDDNFGTVYVFSSQTGKPIYAVRTTDDMASGLGRAITPIGDLDGDDVADFCIGTGVSGMPQARDVVWVSGADGEIIRITRRVDGVPRTVSP